MGEVLNCNQCHNACKLDEVKCGRGEKFRDYILSGGSPEEYVPKKGEGHDGEREHGRHGEHGDAERERGHERHGEHGDAERGKGHGKHGGHHHHHREDSVD